MATAPQVEKLLYSMKDAEYALSLSNRTLRYMIADKRILPRRVGGRVLIPLSEIRRVARQDTPISAKG
jgi:hypothetical protein